MQKGWGAGELGYIRWETQQTHPHYAYIIHTPLWIFSRCDYDTIRLLRKKLNREESREATTYSLCSTHNVQRVSKTKKRLHLLKKFSGGTSFILCCSTRLTTPTVCLVGTYYWNPDLLDCYFSRCSIHPWSNTATFFRKLHFRSSLLNLCTKKRLREKGKTFIKIVASF